MNLGEAVAETLDRRVALVSGGGNGIGEAASAALASAGAWVVIADINRSAAERVATAIRSAGGRAVSVVCDVRRCADVEQAVATAVAEFGGLDIVVSSAGTLRSGTAPELSEDDWDAVFDTNLKGPFLVARAAIPRLRERGGGVIINVASVQAYASARKSLIYGASKAGLVSLTKGMAVDHASDNIRVVGVAPGSVRTPMLIAAARGKAPNAVEDVLAAWGDQHPIGRIIEPDEVAALIVFLSSDSARAITGSTHLVDGGFNADLRF